MVLYLLDGIIHCWQHDHNDGYLIDIMMTNNVINDGYIVLLILAVLSLSRLVMFSGVLEYCMSWTCWFIIFYGVVWILFWFIVFIAMRLWNEYFCGVVSTFLWSTS